MLKYINRLTGQEKDGGQPKGPGKKSLTDCAKELQAYGAAVAVLQLQDLQAYWLSIMSDSSVSAKDRLSASKLYAQSIGALDKQKGASNGAANGYRYGWRRNNTADSDGPIVDVETAD